LTSGLAALVVALTEASKLARLSPSLITSNLGRGAPAYYFGAPAFLADLLFGERGRSSASRSEAIADSTHPA
jgi:hypothetical protein